MILLFFIILTVLALIDYNSFTVPNWIVLPAIGIGIYYTHLWREALLLFCISALLFNRGFWRGGDVKLMAFIGSFLGLKALGVLALSILVIACYRLLLRYKEALPVTPFALASALLFVIV